MANARGRLRARGRSRIRVKPKPPSIGRCSASEFFVDRRDDRFAIGLPSCGGNDLQSVLAEAEPDVSELIQIERNMRQNYLGLECDLCAIA